MQALATGLLASMAALYVLASVAERRWPIAAWLRAFTEAAMVGGIADWFAVTALFRRPLGLPIPHTAIIPRGKDRIGSALGRFIVENFLSPRVLDAKLRQLELASWGGRWLQTRNHPEMVAARVVRLLPDVVRALPEGVLGEASAAIVLAGARAIPAAPTASALLAAIWDEGRAQPLVERAAELLGSYLAEHQDVILEKVQGQSWRWLPGWVDRAIARKITAGLVQLLSDVRQPDHPWRERLGEFVELWIERLANDAQLREEGEALKARLLADPRLAVQAQRMWAELRRRLEAGDLAQAAQLQARLATLLHALGDWLARDTAVQRTLNTTARTLVRRGLAPRREEIGRFVAQVVQDWDADSVVERLELQVGPDLQFIRLNGTLVGGLIGLALFALSRLLDLR